MVVGWLCDAPAIRTGTSGHLALACIQLCLHCIMPTCLQPTLCELAQSGISLSQMLLCSINVFSVAGHKPSAAGRERTAYAGDFAVPSAMASSGKAHALLANIVSWCLNSLLLRRTDLQRLAHTCTYLCLCNIFATPSVCKDYIWLHCRSRLCQTWARTVTQLTSCHCKMSLHTDLSYCHCSASAPHTHRTMASHKQ